MGTYVRVVDARSTRLCGRCKQRSQAPTSRGAERAAGNATTTAARAERTTKERTTTNRERYVANAMRRKQTLIERANRLPRRALPQASMRRLRRARPARPRVRPCRAQELRHRGRAAQPQLAVGPRRDRRLRGGLCKLSSSADGPARRVRARGGSSTVEPRPSKAMMRVQFPSAASSVLAVRRFGRTGGALP